MKPYYILLIFLIIPITHSVSFKDAMTNLKTLEKYIAEYKTEKNNGLSLNHLILAFIRQGKYNDATWTIVAGMVPGDLYDYIKDKDAEYNTKALDCRNYGDILLPTKKNFDFVHMFAVMNGMEFMPSSAALVGWGGDLAQLAQDLKNNFGSVTDLDQLIQEARKFLGIKGQFGEGDLNSDLDAPIILKRKKSSATFAETIQHFYDVGEYKNKIKDFVNIIFPGLTDKSKFRSVIYEKYNADTLINILECKYGLREGGSFLKCYSPNGLLPQYVNHQKAAVYAFADYLSENY